MIGSIVLPAEQPEIQRFGAECLQPAQRPNQRLDARPRMSRRILKVRDGSPRQYSRTNSAYAFTAKQMEEDHEQELVATA